MAKPTTSGFTISGLLDRSASTRNSIKFALDHGRGDLEWVSSKLDECALLLAQVDEGRCEMAGELASLEGRAIVGGD